MAINLLPSEQKLKFKKQKSVSETHNIEMTDPKKVEKSKSSIKSGGVLGFFKQAFRTPKIDKKDDEKRPETSENIKRTKILLKEKLKHKTAHKVPKIEYHIPTRKPEFSQNKPSVSIGSKISNVFDRPKITKTKSVKQNEIKMPIKPKDEFPKYHSVSTEQLVAKKNIKPSKVKVIEVVSENGGDKKKKKSIWSKIQEWFSNLFGKKEKLKLPAPDPKKISDLKGFPKPKDAKLELEYEKEVSKPATMAKEEVDKKIGQPKKPEEKGKLSSPIEVEEEITVEKPEAKEKPKPEFKFESVSYDEKPEKQEKIVSSNFLDKETNINIDKVIKEEGKGASQEKKEDKPGLWHRFMDWLTNLFQKKEKEQITLSAPPVTKPEEEKKPESEKEQPKAKLDFVEKNQEKKESEKKEEKADPKPVPPPMPEVPSPPKQEIKKEEPEVIQEEIEKEVPKKEIEKEISYVAPPKPVVQKPAESKKEKVEPKIKLDVPKKEKQPRNYFGWWSKFWASIISLFKVTKKKNKKVEQTDPNLMTTVKENTKLEHEKNKSSFKEIDFNQPLEDSENKIESTPQPPLPSSSDVTPQPPKAENIFSHDDMLDDIKSDINIKKESNNLPTPPPSLSSDKDQKNSDDKNEFSKSSPLTSVEGGSGVDWEVNLIPEDEQKKEVPVSKILYLIMAIILSGAVVFGGWLWASYYFNNISTTISEVDAEIFLKETDISKYNQLQEDARLVQNKITNVKELLNKHIYWSEFFNKLEFYTISEVYYRSMSVDVNGTVTLTATGSSYENAVKQLLVFERANDFVTMATISDITFQDVTIASEDIQDNNVQVIDSEELNVNFNINLEVQPEIFYYPKIGL